MGRIGLTVPPPGVPLPGLPALLREVADAGFTDVWSSESNGADAFTPLIVAAAEPRLRLGTAVAGYLTRGPALLAQQAAALAELAPGRTVIGIGASSAPIVGGWNGLPFDRRIARARDTIDFLRAAFTGEPVAREFATFASHGFRLARPPMPAPPVLLAALGPRMLRLGLEHGDGVVLNWLAPQDVPVLLGEVPPGKEVVCRVMVCPVDDAERVRDAVRGLFAAYLNVPTYRAFQERLGRAELLAPMWRAWREGDRAAAARLVPDQVIDDLVVHGDPARCGERLRAYAAAGVTTTVFAVVDVAGTGRFPLAELAAVAEAARRPPEGPRP